MPYLWSARRLVVLGVDADEQSQVFDVDEDIVTVFWIREGWLVVCETSVRLLSSRGEACRLELPDVVVSARWAGAALELQHPTTRTRLGIADGRLQVL
ncbi:MAG TPA: hypothetical protein VM324_02490 [Egibacteraceae bacterium]|nr:hypothetical protein [Egibacteraceae bacterium]